MSVSEKDFRDSSKSLYVLPAPGKVARKRPGVLFLKEAAYISCAVGI